MTIEALHCPSCGAAVPGHATQCRYCGASLRILSPQSVSSPIIAAASQPAPFARPRSLIPVDYRADRPVEWVIIASFANASGWHNAAKYLTRVGIMARQAEDPNNAEASALAVFSNEADSARQVLAAMPDSGALEADSGEHAFPVILPESRDSQTATDSSDNVEMPPPSLPQRVIPVYVPPPGGSLAA